MQVSNALRAKFNLLRSSPFKCMGGSEGKFGPAFNHKFSPRGMFPGLNLQLEMEALDILQPASFWARLSYDDSP